MPGGGESRPGQFEMCEAVASALEQDRHLVVAAGTGTGKSMAYLAPLAAGGRKAVVATATKALQDQLVDKDLPLLAEALGMPLKFGVLKGRSNYVCRKKLADLAAVAGSGQQQLIAADSAAEAGRIRKEIARLAAWADVTADGDRAGLDFEPSVRAWEAVSVSGRECPGAANCPSGPECFAEQARDRAAEADVLVVNHHLYCLHVFTEAEILPPHDAAVFDEAHTLEDIAAGAAGVSITGGRFRHAARAVRAAVAGSATADRVAEAGDILRDALDPHRDTLLTSVPDDLVETVAVCRGRLGAAGAEVREAQGDETRRRMARRIYCQGDLPNRELIARFAEEEESCLFATMTMWQGVDVPGRSLSLVVVDRIPFPRPDEPLMVARRRRLGPQAFREIDVPRAATLLAQGAGRLIRSAQDRGVVAVLDSRLATAGYRQDLLRGLPPLRRTIDLAEVEAFLSDIRHAAEAPRPLR